MSPEDKLQPLERALYELMSSVSEDCYCAGWLDGTEYAVWDLLHGKRTGNYIADHATRTEALAALGIAEDRGQTHTQDGSDG